MRKLLKYGILCANLLFVVMLFLGVLSLKISSPFLSYFGLFFLPTVIINVVFVVFWLFVERKWSLLSMITLLLFSPYLQRNFPTNNPKPNDKTDIVLLTYNVALFNFNTQTRAILNEILLADADIVCLQEFGFFRENDKRDIVFATLREKYPYKHVWYKNQFAKSETGVCTFSKYPIVNKKKIQYDSKNNISIYSDIVIGKDTIRVMNNHLESNKLSDKEREQFNKIEANKETLNLMERISQKYSFANQTRAQQAEVIAKERDKSPHKTVICGDFNDVAMSYVYETIRGEMKDVYLETQTGLEYTFSEGFLRSHIDHILIDPSFVAKNCEIKHNSKLSDHSILIGRFSIK